MVYLATGLVIIGIFLLIYGAVLPYYKIKRFADRENRPFVNRRRAYPDRMQQSQSESKGFFSGLGRSSFQADANRAANFGNSNSPGNYNSYNSKEQNYSSQNRNANSFAEGFLQTERTNAPSEKFSQEQAQSAQEAAAGQETVSNYTNTSSNNDYINRSDLRESQDEHLHAAYSQNIPNSNFQDHVEQRVNPALNNQDPQGQQQQQYYANQINQSMQAEAYRSEAAIRQNRELQQASNAPKAAEVYGNPVEVSSKKAREQKAPIITGTLFLDKSRDISYTGEKLEIEKLDPASIQFLKRVDRAECQILGSDIIFHTDVSSFLYRQRNLSRIIFYKNAFVIIPRDDSLPVPVFLTTEGEKFKNYFYQLSD